jgi:hypothetical protein
MRRTAPMRWNEEAEARKVRLLAAESMPTATRSGGATQSAASRTGVTLMLAKMTGGVARLTRPRPSRRRSDPPADGPDCASRWRAGVGRAVSAISERSLLDRRAA